LTLSLYILTKQGPKRLRGHPRVVCQGPGNSLKL
jgi:hypothetical protein